MFGKLAKIFAYMKAPVKTFAVLHPIKMLKYGAVFWVGKKLFFSDKPRGSERTRTRPSDPEAAGPGPEPGSSGTTRAGTSPHDPEDRPV